MKIKLFYSYSHKDAKYREELEKHLTILRDNGLIEEWHDGKIEAGDNWDKEIEKNIENSHIILLLFSSDFIASKSCQKEVQRAVDLSNKKNIVFIPIILRECAWKEIGSIASIQGLPKGVKSIQNWDDQDTAWKNVYDGIKKKVQTMSNNVTPKIKEEFKKNLLHNPTLDIAIDKLFIYPDIIKRNSRKKIKLENNETDSIELQRLSEFQNKYILIEGEEQCGKTSLCKMLYIHYLNTKFYPILINGQDISGKADIQKIVEIQYNNQYESTENYWSIEKEKRIIFIDDISRQKASYSNFSAFVASIKEYFEFAIVFIDKTTNLSNKVTNLTNQRKRHNFYSYFQIYSIKSLGHKKRDELIKKCIAHDEQMDFDMSNSEQLARLDRTVNHINTIIGSNIVPSYPGFISIIFHTVESIMKQDLSKTSYGHCYQAMITINLVKSGIKKEDIDACLNFLTELAYFMFSKNSKTITEPELNRFSKQYKEKFTIHEDIIKKILTKTNIIKKQNNIYKFQYVYIYYYFIAKFISQAIDEETIKSKIEELMDNIHMKDNANIIIFIAHHTNNKIFQNNIINSANSLFKKFSEATLEGTEKNFINIFHDALNPIQLPESSHDFQKEREETLQKSDKLDSLNEQVDDEEQVGDELTDDPLLIEIRKASKNIEIIGQILKNQYGSMEKNQQKNLFEAGQNVGLRLLKSFIELMFYIHRNSQNFILPIVETMIQQQGKKNSEEENKKTRKKIIDQISHDIDQSSYDVLHGWVCKIVDSLGYHKLTAIADEVDNKINTVASKLINFFIHTWHAKKLDLKKIQALYYGFKKDKNHQAIYFLKDIVASYIYMHYIDYKDKQRIDNLLEFSIKDQRIAQKKIKK